MQDCEGNDHQSDSGQCGGHQLDLFHIHIIYVCVMLWTALDQMGCPKLKVVAHLMVARASAELGLGRAGARIRARIR